MTPEERVVYNANWYVANREKCRALNAANYAANPKKANARSAANYAANRDKQRARHKAWVANHPEARRMARARRRAKEAQAAINDFTAQQWRDMQAAYDHRCVYCGKQRKGKLTIDHITPISKGGNHTLSNIVPACGICNSRKHAGPVLAPVQPLLLL